MTKHPSYRVTVALLTVLLIGTVRASAQGPSAGLYVGSGSFEYSSTPPAFEQRAGGGALSYVQEKRFAFLALQQELSAGGGAGTWQRRLAIIQGSYYLTSGLWPILSMETFEKVTGPKTDDWLVKTVGALIAVTGGTLLVSGLGEGPSNDLQLLAAGSAAALTVVDVTYVSRGRISRIYLLDAVAEIVLLAGWMIL